MNENKDQAQNEKRVIKKYPNRRLYDTSESKYVTLSDVRELVLSGISFCVIDKKSGEDITRSILLQIIIEQEEEGDPMFSTDVLEQMKEHGHVVILASQDALAQANSERGGNWIETTNIL